MRCLSAAPPRQHYWCAPVVLPCVRLRLRAPRRPRDPRATVTVSSLPLPARRRASPRMRRCSRATGPATVRRRSAVASHERSRQCARRIAARRGRRPGCRNPVPAMAVSPAGRWSARVASRRTGAPARSAAAVARRGARYCPRAADRVARPAPDGPRPHRRVQADQVFFFAAIEARSIATSEAGLAVGVAAAGAPQPAAASRGAASDVASTERRVAPPFTAGPPLPYTNNPRVVTRAAVAHSSLAAFRSRMQALHGARIARPPDPTGAARPRLNPIYAADSG